MDLITAIKHAIEGRALLFFGSGGSVGASPVGGGEFLTGRGLSHLLSKEANISPSSEDLNFSSQRFRKLYGDHRLIQLLQNQFTAATVSDYHRRLADINWHGIYTTNYDNILERAFSERRKKLIPITPDKDSRAYTRRHDSVLHINGYIDSLTPESLGADFKLTNTSYLTEAFAKSNWSFVFRRNLETARAIIFVGYSMYDIDIQRIMYGGDSLKEKTVFVEREDKSQEEIESSLQIDFGSVYPVGLKGFWEEYDRVSADYIPQELDTTLFAFSELQPLATPEPLRDDDVFRLLLAGDYRQDLVWSSVAGGLSAPYYIVREQLLHAHESVCGGARNIVLVSDLANGKSMLAFGLACKLAAEGYQVFTLNEEVDNTAEELNRLCSISGKVALIIENYSRRLDEVRQAQAKRHEEMVLILTIKNSLHEVYQGDLVEILEPDRTAEFDLNTISGKDVPSLIGLLDGYKLWGDRDALPDSRKRDFVLRECGGQLSGVLLDIVKSPEIQRRYHQLFDAFKSKSEFADVVVAASVLKMLGFSSPKESLISELLDSNYVYSLGFKLDPLARELLSFSSGAVFTRSSILAKYGLTMFSDARALVDRLIRIASSAHDRGQESELYFGIYRDLVTFSVVQGMLPEKGKRDSLIRLYEGLKNLRSAKNHPHFWLQYAIARLASDRPEDLQAAKLFLDSAYAQAEKRRNYHTRHLDNVQARYWIQHAISVEEINAAILELNEGHRLLLKQARTEKVDSPYKVARLYLSFYNAKKSKLTGPHKILIKSMVNTVLSLSDGLPDAVKGHSTVKHCRSDLESILADMGAT